MPRKPKRTLQEQLKIGKEIFDKEINKYEAAEKYNINFYTARDYYRRYKATLGQTTSQLVKERS